MHDVKVHSEMWLEKPRTRDESIALLKEAFGRECVNVGRLVCTVEGSGGCGCGQGGAHVRIYALYDGPNVRRGGAGVDRRMSEM
jgi:hypothetical protein